MAGIAVVSEVFLLRYRNRTRVIFNWLVGVILFFSLVQLAISAYAQMNSWTQWGYPSIIFDSVRWEYLGYASMVFLVIFVILNVLAYRLRLKDANMEVPLK